MASLFPAGNVEGGDEPACKPDSVLGFPRGDHPSATAVASDLVRSTREHRAGHSFTQIGCPILLTLLPVGFTEPPQSPAVLVVSYTTLSPLPLARRFAFCGTVPRVAPGGRYPPPFPVESGLSSMRLLAPRSPGRLVRTQGTTPQVRTIRRSPRPGIPRQWSCSSPRTGIDRERVGCSSQ